MSNRKRDFLKYLGFNNITEAVIQLSNDQKRKEARENGFDEFCEACQIPYNNECPECAKLVKERNYSEVTIQDWLQKNNPYTNPLLSSTWTEGAMAIVVSADALFITALTEQLKEFKLVCQNFVEKVETGEARSKRTYCEMKNLLEKYPNHV